MSRAVTAWVGNSTTSTLRPGTAKRAVLLASPTLALFAIVVHPQLGGEPAARLVTAAEHTNRWLVADLLALGALAAFPFFVGGLASMGWDAASRLVVTGAALALMSIPLVAGQVTLDMAVWALANGGHTSTPPSGEFLDDPVLVTLFTVAPIACWLGLVLLGIALLRTGPGLRYAGLALACGSFLAGVVAPVSGGASEKPLSVVGATLLVVAAGWIRGWPHLRNTIAHC